MFGRVKPEDQMADSVTVGTVGSGLPKCEVCTNWRIHKGFLFFIFKNSLLAFAIHKGVVPQSRRDGTIYQIDQKSNGQVPDDIIPPRLSGSIAPSAGISVAPTPKPFTACPSEYDSDPMDYTDLEDLGYQQDASEQLMGDAGEARDRHQAEGRT